VGRKNPSGPRVLISEYLGEGRVKICVAFLVRMYKTEGKGTICTGRELYRVRLGGETGDFYERSGKRGGTVELMKAVTEIWGHRNRPPSRVQHTVRLPLRVTQWRGKEKKKKKTCHRRLASPDKNPSSEEENGSLTLQNAVEAEGKTVFLCRWYAE